MNKLKTKFMIMVIELLLVILFNDKYTDWYKEVVEDRAEKLKAELLEELEKD